jgi:hypothetical protein
MAADGLGDVLGGHHTRTILLDGENYVNGAILPMEDAASDFNTHQRVGIELAASPGQQS